MFIQNEYLNGLIHNRYTKTTSFHSVEKSGDKVILKYNLKEFYYNNSIVPLNKMNGRTLYCLVNVTVKDRYSFHDLGTTAFKIVID